VGCTKSMNYRKRVWGALTSTGWNVSLMTEVSVVLVDSAHQQCVDWDWA
jgi:hypothetical protein